MPAEWEPHRAVIVSFDNDLYGDSVSVEMVKNLCQDTRVYCLIASDTLISFYTNWFKKENIVTDSIKYILFGSSFTYSCRDPLFFLKNNKNEFRLMDFEWNDYGYMPDSSKREKYLKVAAQDRKSFENNFLATFPYPTIQSKMVNEGGAIEVNGKGVLLQVESVNMNRNPNWTREDQEKELKKVLGINKVIWLKQGPADDPDGRVRITGNYFGIGVNGHIDEFCRFANKSTIFMTYPDVMDTINNPVAKTTYERMVVNYKILKNATDQDGKHFEIIKFPIPELTYKTYILDSSSVDNEIKSFSKRVLRKYNNFHNRDTCYSVPASSYLNYFVTNKKILIPKYWKPGEPEIIRLKDEKVRKLFEQYFPDKQIIQINPTGLNYLGGGIHCWSQQIPQ